MEWFQIPNYVEGRTEEIDLIVVHATRSGILGNNDRISTINWFKNPRAQASSHRLYDTDGWVGGFVADWDTAWGAGYLNARSLHAECCQPTIDTPFTDFQIVSLANDVRLWCEIHDIPKIRIFDENQRGIIGHEDTAQGKSWGKTDPGYLFPWDSFMQIVQGEDMNAERLGLLMHWAGLLLSGDGKLIEQAYMEMKYVRAAAGKSV